MHIFLYMSLLIVWVQSVSCTMIYSSRVWCNDKGNSPTISRELDVMEGRLNLAPLFFQNESAFPCPTIHSRRWGQALLRPVMRFRYDACNFPRPSIEIYRMISPAAVFIRSANSLSPWNDGISCDGVAITFRRWLSRGVNCLEEEAGPSKILYWIGVCSRQPTIVCVGWIYSA